MEHGNQIKKLKRVKSLFWVPILFLLNFNVSCSCGDNGKGEEDGEGEEFVEDSDLDFKIDDSRYEGDGDTESDFELETCLPCSGDNDCPNAGGPFCQGRYRCVEGCCIEESPPGCNDNIYCTIDNCDEENERCLHQPDNRLCEEGEICNPYEGCIPGQVCISNEDCDDGIYCNGVESCSGGTCVGGRNPCDDSIHCTRDFCVEESHECINEPDDSKCNPDEICSRTGCRPKVQCPPEGCSNGLSCDGEEYCDSEGICRPDDNPPPPCNDGINCTNDFCVEKGDGFSPICAYIPDHTKCLAGQFCSESQGCIPIPSCMSDSDCDDGFYCNGVELCARGVCIKGIPPDCNDGVDCTNDYCDEAEDRCVNFPENSRCHEGEKCDQVHGCIPATQCCTSNAECDDGKYCNGEEFCQSCNCVRGIAPNCDDGIRCTIDQCLDSINDCLHTPDNRLCQENEICQVAEGCVYVECSSDSECNDGLYCNGQERCGPDRLCHSGEAVRCEDDAYCTINEGCDEESDRCTHVQRSCDDGLYCTRDLCNEELDTCQHIPISCDDGNECTEDSCDNIRGCVNEPLDIDGDGHPSSACGGDDCNDTNPRIFHGECNVGEISSCLTSCASQGTKTCNYDCTWSSCQPPNEICDGLDNDCDPEHVADNGFPCARGSTNIPCTTTCGTSGTAPCHYDCSLPSPSECIAQEICNGRDDDCDGVADNGFACIQDLPTPCTTRCGSTGTGICTHDCHLPPPLSCTPPPEICNGVDDNCDGRIDENFPCARGQTVQCQTTCGSTGTGICTSNCQIPTGSSCTPPPEQCNGVDDDCDEGIDENFPCVRGQQVNCITTCGTQGYGYCTDNCSIPIGNDCFKPPESCNGIDDDCDGISDNGFECRLGSVQACYSGLCSGTQLCLSECRWGACNFGSAPSNDTCSTPQNLYPQGGLITGSTCSATDNESGSIGGNGAADVVYRFTITSNMDVELNTVGTSFDSILYVRSTACNGTEIAYGDNEYGNSAEIRLPNLSPGTYYVILDGKTSGDRGPFALEYNITPAGIQGDMCGNTIRITTNGDYNGDARVFGNQEEVVVSPPDCPYDSRGSEIIFSFYVSSPRTITFSTCNDSTQYDTILYVRDVCKQTLSQIACDDDSCGAPSLKSNLTVTLGPGLYYLFVDGRDPSKPDLPLK